MSAVLSLYSGVLGLDRAFAWHGFQTVAACDSSPYCRHVIAHYLPGIPIYESDEEVHSERLRRDDINPDTLVGVIGGPPCQPSSIAGQRLGTADRRWRWPETVRIVGDLRPRWVVLEQPPGILTLRGGSVFLDILGRLAALGYRVGYDQWPAGAVGAPQGRLRVAVIALRLDVADALSEQRQRRGESDLVGGAAAALDPDAPERQRGGDAASDRGTAGRVGVSLANPDGAGLPQHADGAGQSRRGQSAPLGNGGSVGLADAPRGGLSPRRAAPAGPQGRPDAEQRSASGTVADAHRHGRLQPAGRIGDIGGWLGDSGHGGGAGAVAVSQPALGRDLDGLSGGLAHLWPAGRGHQQYPWEPARLVTRPPRGSAQNLVTEAELEALGNAVVSQQFEPVAAAMAEVERAWEGRADGRPVQMYPAAGYGDGGAP